MNEAESQPGSEKRLHGIGVSPGISRGTIFVYRTDDEDEPPVRRIPESEVPGETPTPWKRFSAPGCDSASLIGWQACRGGLAKWHGYPGATLRY